MKARFLGETDPLSLKNGEVYDVISIETGPAGTQWFRIALENDDDDGSELKGYLYSAASFEGVV